MADRSFGDAASAPHYAPGDTIGDYALIESRGAGGMGQVWEVTSRSGDHYALKLMHQHWADDLSLVARFRREFDVGNRIQHPNLVRMYAYDGTHRPPYLVMQLAPGKSLKRLLEKGGPFREWEVAAIGGQVADALAVLRRNGVTHRDLKASNIMVDRSLHVTLIDYGIARLQGEATIASGEAFIGSAEYSSPEPYLGREVDPSSDIYSLGIVLFEALVGAVPFRSDRYTDTLRMHAELPVPRISQRIGLVSPMFDNLVYAMLQKQPERRPTAEQVALACRAIAQEHGRPAPVAPARPVPAAPPADYDPPSTSAPPQMSRPADPSFAPGSPPPDPLPTALFVALGAVALALVVVVLAIAGAN